MVLLEGDTRKRRFTSDRTWVGPDRTGITSPSLRGGPRECPRETKKMQKQNRPPFALCHPSTSENTASERWHREFSWKTPLLFLWLIVSLPYVSYTMWRALSHLAKNDWISLATRTRALHRVGFMTRTTRYWLATSYTKLSLWNEAVAEFECMSRALDTPADDAARYCAHVFALSKLGRVDEARELLTHAIQDDWPEERRSWAGKFIEANTSPIYAELPVALESTLLH